MNPILHLSVPLILASQSPRRKALLERPDMPFEVHVSPADETLEEPAPPSGVVQQLARQKAEPVASEHPESLVLAADTVVAHGDEILNKPPTEAAARRMLRYLSGTHHSVYTGIALEQASSARSVTAVESTRVIFGELDDREIDAYVASGSPMDKAGAYGIQDHTGSLLVERIEGDYYNVVGLPLRRLYLTLRRRFGDVLSPPPS